MRNLNETTCPLCGYARIGRAEARPNALNCVEQAGNGIATRAEDIARSRPRYWRLPRRSQAFIRIAHIPAAGAGDYSARGYRLMSGYDRPPRVATGARHGVVISDRAEAVRAQRLDPQPTRIRRARSSDDAKDLTIQMISLCPGHHQY